LGIPAARPDILIMPAIPITRQHPESGGFDAARQFKRWLMGPQNRRVLPDINPPWPRSGVSYISLGGQQGLALAGNWGSLFGIHVVAGLMWMRPKGRTPTRLF
jgi:hypothetical protein